MYILMVTLRIFLAPLLAGGAACWCRSCGFGPRRIGFGEPAMLGALGGEGLAMGAAFVCAVGVMAAWCGGDGAAGAAFVCALGGLAA